MHAEHLDVVTDVADHSDGPRIRDPDDAAHEPGPADAA